MKQNAVQNYLKRKVPVFGFELPAWLWMVGAFGSICALAILAYAYIRYGGGIHGFSVTFTWLIAAGFAVAFLGFFLVLLRAIFTSLFYFIVFTIVIAGLSFGANAYLLSHEVFPPFTIRTEIALWICFAILALSPFQKRFPGGFAYAFQPVLAFGAMLCLAFVFVLAPIMAFSWLVVWAGGLGFLPYSPLFALIAFVLSLRKMHQYVPNKKLSAALISCTIALTLAYSVYYKVQWNRAESVLREEKPVLGNNQLNNDLPEWVRKASRLSVNHVTEMVLQPNRRSELSLFNLQTQFDPLAFFSSGGMDWIFRGRSSDRISAEDSGHILHLLFGQSFAYLDRLWRGHSLITTDVASHVQIHPELRAAYTETTISVYNEESTSGSSFFGLRLSGAPLPGEAIYTLTLPEGSVCTKLSLWINGEERPARLTFKSKARHAYETIVGVERRDPSYVEWLDGNRLRLKVFPVQPGEFRTVRVGIVSPLKAENKRLTYHRLALEGPVETFADEKVDVDVFSSVPIEGTGLVLKEKTVTDGQVRQFRGEYIRSNWSISLAATTVNSTISSSGMSYNVRPLNLMRSSFKPDAILIALNTSRTRSEWKEFIRSLYEFDIPVYMLANEWFHTTDKNRAMTYLDDCEIPAFNLFPLYFPKEKKLGKVLWIVSGENQSIPFGELRGSERFEKTQADPVSEFVAILNGRQSEYVSSLIDLNRLTRVANSADEILKILRDKEVYVSVTSDTVVPLEYAGIQLEKTQIGRQTPGSDLLIRMMIQRKIMRILGQRFFDRDTENADLVELARSGMIVSPVSTLIVLETENDYKRFGIGNDPSLLGQSKLEQPGGVPEPHEIALIVLLLLGLLWYAYQRKTAAHHAAT